MRRLIRFLGTAGVILLLNSAIVSPAHAAEANPFIGRWYVYWDGNSKPEKADLEITATGGQWQTYAPPRVVICIGRLSPLQITQADANEMRFTVQVSEILQGCNDFKVRLKAEADGTITGRRGKSALRLERR